MKNVRPSIRTIDIKAARPLDKKADAELQTPLHRAWRDIVLKRAGYRCEAIDQNGTRCETAAPQRLFADHIIERQDGGPALDINNGRCLCGRHHTIKTIAERSKRMAELIG